MAEEAKTTIVTDAKDGAESPPAKKGMNKLILFGGIGLGAIVIGLVLALFVIKPMLSGPPADDSSAAEASEQPEAEHADSKETEKHETPKKESSHKKESSGHGGSSSASILHAIDNIVVNPAGTGGSRYLSVSIAFELGGKEVESMFADREAVIRDALITILSSKSVSQLTDAREKEITRLQIKKRVEALLKTEDIAGVYYTDFVLQ